MTEMENKNPKAYWQLFKKLKETSDNDEQAEYISEQEWVEHYKHLLGSKLIKKYKSQRIIEEIECLSNMEPPHTNELNQPIVEEKNSRCN